MKKLLSFLVALVCCFSMNAQLVDVIVETFGTSTGTYPAGYTTYRVFARLQDPTDFLSSVYGIGAAPADPDHQLIIGDNVLEPGSHNLWNSNAAGLTGPDVNLVFCGFIPEMCYDSYITIGRANNTAPGGPINSLTTPNGAFNTTFVTFPFGTPNPVNDGAWFALLGDVNGFPTGADNRVQLLQVTCPTGALQYQINLQVFDEGVGANSLYYCHTLEGPPGIIGGIAENDGTCLGLVYPDPGVCSAIPGCTDPTACNYDNSASEDDGSCTYPGCVDPTACNFNMAAGCDDGSCTYPGCIDAAACNYIPAAGCDDGSCTYPGCTDPTACNYDVAAGCDNGSCTYPGCIDPTACNFNVAAGCDDGSCTYPGCIDPTACNFSATAGCDNGSCTYPGCIDPAACNFDAAAGCDDGSCTYPGCIDPTACNFSVAAGCDDGSCTYPGCTDLAACNYNPASGCNDGSCTYPGCTDPLACNYDVNAGCDDGSCTVAGCIDILACNFDPFAACDNGTCDYSCYGCTDPSACNFDPTATIEDGSCDYGTCSGCTNPAACNYQPGATIDDGSCTFPGCTDNTACNYNATAGCDDGSCTYPGCTDVAACNYNATAGCNDGSCTYPGCTDPTACNFSVAAGCDDGSCTYPGCTNPSACNFNVTAGCDDGSCTYPGCDDAAACNYDPTAGCNDGSCVYPGCDDAAACNYDQTAGCNDGSCTYPGCTDAAACNYDATAGCEDGSCDYSCYGCTDPSACNFDSGATLNDGSCDYSCYGCTDPTACNFNGAATIDDGTCTYPPCIANDVPAGAVALAVTPLGTCSPVSDDLSGSSNSPESSASGNDLWYSITAVTPGLRIEVVDVNPQDLAIDLLDAALNPVDAENLVAGNGGENLNYGDLTPGATYYISVSGNTGAFSICAQWIQDSDCDYGPGPYNLCDMFKADWVLAAGYAFEFTSNTTLITYTYEKAAALQPNTFVKLSDVAGLTWGDTYDVNCLAFYNLTNGSGATEKVYVNSGSVCNITINPAPTMILRPSDNCANFGPHLLGQTIAGQPFVCGAVDYEWEFTRTDMVELPFTKLRGAANRFLNLNTVAGLVAGATYDVRVRPIFSYGPGAYGAADCLSIIGPVGMTTEGPVADQMASEDKVEVDGIATAIYPNPNAGTMLNINLTGVASEIVNVDVRDQMGRLVHSAQYTVNNGSLNGIITFNKQLAGGMYTITFNADGEVRTERFVVNR